ncbi:MAG TPA: tRNA pseudouridine(55) synthase TruB [Candidatus Acidoferrales bacterium]|nr:tRNA pseudouridine(55) synthase TruB [Candidatus Acidoferrales bacterium]
MPRKQQPAAFDGALVMDKPRGKTSHDVVEAVRRIVGFRQVGHLGTLDPLATGVLVLLLGRATRLAQFYSGRRKRYLATFRFGYATDTYDADGTASGPDLAPTLVREEVEKLAAQLTGRYEQMPPPYSAKKIHGKSAHELARKNKPVELKAVEIEVYEFRVDQVEGPRARVAIECAAGTYIRSIAHEMGKQLGCGAHLEEISRTAVGEFTLDRAVKVEELAQAQKTGRLADWILPLERLLPELPKIIVLPIVERAVRHGAKFNVVPSQVQPGRVEVAQGAPAELDSGEWKPARLRVFSAEEKLLAIAEAIVPRTYRPVVVLSAEN